jgi:hypothetical protein
MDHPQFIGMPNIKGENSYHLNLLSFEVYKRGDSSLLPEIRLFPSKKVISHNARMN